jgi:ATP adenylyltransferase
VNFDLKLLPENLRYQALKEAGGRCALRGATKAERILDVDHIKPRSRGGKNENAKLQLLCSSCNRSKGNQDDTDSRGEMIGSGDDCPFCYDNCKDRIVEEFESVFAIKDQSPVSEGHLLVIPKRHAVDYFSLTESEKRNADRLLQMCRKRILENDDAVTGFNVGINSGTSAGQTVFHCHIHLIPRRDGDTPSPRGGVRGVIPGKMSY